MPSDVALAPNGDLYIADMHHNRVRKVDAKTQHHHDRRRQRRLGLLAATTGRRRRRSWRVRPASRVVPEPGGKVTIFIADYYNGHVRAVGPDGIIRDVSDEGREAFGAPTRVAFAPRSAAGSTSPTRARTRSSPLIIPKIAPNLVPPRPVPPPRQVGG